MSNVFTLDSMREELDKKYGSAVIDVDGVEVYLRPLMRLKSGPYKEVSAKLSELKELQGEKEEASLDELAKISSLAEDILMVVADKPDELILAMDGDMSLILQVFEAWMGDTQAGEASSSEG